MIYVLTTGTYSDYRIKGVYTDYDIMNRSKKNLERISGEEYFIEEYEENKDVKDDYYMYIVNFDRRNNIEDIQSSKSDEESVYISHTKGSSVCLFAENDEQAKKIAKDRLMIELAKKECIL